MLVIGLPTVPLLAMLRLARLRWPLLIEATATMMALPPMRLAELAPLIVLPVIATMFVASFGMPMVPPGPLALPLPPLICMPEAVGKFEIVLLLIVALFRTKTVVAVPVPLMLMPKPCEVVVLVVLVIVLFEMVAF